MSLKNLLRSSMVIPLITGSICFMAPKSHSADLFFIKACFSDDPEVSKFGGECFMGTYDIIHSPLIIIFVLVPLLFLKDNGSTYGINTAQLTEMGYTSEEIADLSKDIKALQSAMAQRKTPFNSALEMKAWMQSFPLAPITLELMRFQN